ncbi:MAG TPA: hypothetical protein VFC34_09610 [Puia sp.]|nr:hypothetical protein [Puia sp.]
MIPQGPQFHKPKSIIAASGILYATIVLVILGFLVGEFSAGLQGLITTMVTIGLLNIIMSQIGLGRKWARTVFLILVIIPVTRRTDTCPIFLPCEPGSGLPVCASDYFTGQGAGLFIQQRKQCLVQQL